MCVCHVEFNNLLTYLPERPSAGYHLKLFDGVGQRTVGFNPPNLPSIIQTLPHSVNIIRTLLFYISTLCHNVCDVRTCTLLHVCTVTKYNNNQIIMILIL